MSPSLGHVYGLRVASLARAMAARGHSVLMLAPAPRGAAADETEVALAERIRSHAWCEPLLVERALQPKALLSLQRSASTPGVVRRALTAGLILTQGGVQGDWVAGARPVYDTIAGEFRPGIVWANFGNLSNLVVGQQLAARARAPWAIDFKDNFANYVPAGLHKPLARRFRNAVAVTTNAVLHGDAAGRWFRQPRTVIYSGVAPDMVASHTSLPRADRFLVTLVGSAYDTGNLQRFVGALAGWVARGGESRARETLFRYAGAQHADVTDVVERSGLACEATVTPNIPHGELADLCHDAGANCYTWAAFGFHHKALELMACRRPVIVFPGEHPETIDLAKRVAGDLDVCRNEEQLASAFDRAYALWRERRPAAPDLDISGVSWDAGAAQLENIFARAVSPAH
ncbi:MAG: glycosyltransferase family 1 protein [Sphingomonas sp.]|uniref:glycosyltransferase n=1 Tax=Sphingomonas sp. TaxID=28214 RepID=UPI0012095613|nr:hypothetical protein [Sphingomonas sp.]THD37165.1 MAG: glycosyltransferase family 1 protein [Sphingomonas sp.]